MSYLIHLQTGSVIRKSDGKEVAPAQSADDPDFVEYQQWVFAGNEPEVLDLPLQDVPQSVTMRQFQLALLDAELLDDVLDELARLGRAAELDWSLTTDVRRDWRLLEVVFENLGVDSRAVDGLFVVAADK